MSHICCCSNEPIKSGKTPHMCPLCQGNGNKKIPDLLVDDMIMAKHAKSLGKENAYDELILGMLAKCHGCDGKGIVWG